MTDQLSIALKILPALWSFAKPLKRKLSSKPQWWNEVDELIQRSLREFSGEGPQEKAVAELLTEAFKQETPVEDDGSPEPVETLHDLKNRVKTVPSFSAVSAEVNLSEDTLTDCFEKWLGLILLYLPDYPRAAQAAQINICDPNQIVSALSGTTNPTAIVHTPPINTDVKEDAALISLRRSALEGLDDLLRRHQFSHAREKVIELSSALAEPPIPADSRFRAHLDMRTAQIELGLGNGPKALDILRAAGEQLRDPNHPLNEVMFLVTLGRIQEAEELLGKTETAIKETDHGRFIVALVQIEKSKFREAIETLAPVLAKDEAPPEAVANAAVCHSRLGQFEEALRLSEKAVALSKGLARFYETLGDINLRAFHHSLFKASNSATALSYEGAEIGFFESSILAEVKEAKQALLVRAIESYRVAYQQVPSLLESGHFLGNMALTLHLQGEHEEAEELVERVLSLPDALPPYILLVDIKLALEKFDDAESALEEAEALYPRELHLNFVAKRAEIFMKSNRFKEAVDLQTYLIENGRDSAIQFWNRGLAKSAEGDPLGAVEDLEKAASDGEDKLRALRAIANVYSHSKMSGCTIQAKKAVIEAGRAVSHS